MSEKIIAARKGERKTNARAHISSNHNATPSAAAAHFAAAANYQSEKQQERTSLSHFAPLSEMTGDANPGRHPHAQVQIIHAHQLWQISCMDFCLSLMTLWFRTMRACKANFLRAEIRKSSTPWSVSQFSSFLWIFWRVELLSEFKLRTTPNFVCVRRAKNIKVYWAFSKNKY